MTRIIILTMSIWLSAALAVAGPSCNRTYEFLGLSKGQTSVFWISSFSDGHCQDLRLHALAISGDTLDALYSSELASMGVGCAEHIVRLYDHEEPVTLLDSTGDWIKLDSAGSIRCPDTPTKTKDEYKTWAREVALEGWFWNRHSGMGGIVLPQSTGCRLSLVAIDSAGLYLDYTIDRVLYFPASKYLLVFTKNPMFHGEFDSENGFLLLRRVS
jgi:hypothetical protein